MKRNIILAATLLALGLPTVGAWATASSEMTVSNFRVELFDLDTTDGITPQVAFTLAGSGSVNYAGAYSGDPVVSANNWLYTGLMFGSGTSTASPSALANGLAALDGEAQSAAGATVRTAGYASSDTRLSIGEGAVSFGDDAQLTVFTLSANTRMVISGEVQATATSSGGFQEYADSGLLMALGPIDQSQPGGTFDEVGVYSASGGAGIVTNSIDQMASVSFENTTAADLDGYFDGYAASYAQSGFAVSVPEPTTSAAMLAGLGLLAGALRRRRTR